MKDLIGKVAFITGGVSGIGLGMAKVFVDAGMKVVITYISDDHIQEAMEFLKKKKENVYPIRVDVTDRKSMEDAAIETEERYGKVHILVNNAGVGIKNSIKDTTFNDWDWGLDVNLGGVINGIQVFLPRILKHGEGGHIVTTSSMSGVFSVPNASIYNTAKYAVMGLMETIRGELAVDNVGVSVFCPGLVKSNIYQTLRLRPEKYMDQNFKPMTDAEIERSKDIMSKGMDPIKCAMRVLDGIQRNDLFILTHPEFKQGIQDRFEAILASIPDEAVDHERVKLEAKITLRNKIYIDEIKKHSCDEGVTT